MRTYRSALRDLARAEHYAANPTFAPQSDLAMTTTLLTIFNAAFLQTAGILCWLCLP